MYDSLRRGEGVLGELLAALGVTTMKQLAGSRVVAELSHSKRAVVREFAGRVNGWNEVIDEADFKYEEVVAGLMRRLPSRLKVVGLLDVKESLRH